MDDPLAEQLARVRRKVLDRGVRLDPPLSEEQVADFETRVGVRLPEEYRRFLLEIGDGPSEEKLHGRRLSPAEIEEMGLDAGKVVIEHDQVEQKRREGSPYYGLQPLERTVVADRGCMLRPGVAFPLTTTWIWGTEPEPDEARIKATYTDGHLFLGTDGCGMDYLLIVTGPQRGCIWDRADGGACLLSLDFLDWYEQWLDGRPYWQRRSRFQL